jgi:hypothetical protein
VTLYTEGFSRHSLCDCSDYYRLERQLPGGVRTHWKTVPLHGALQDHNTRLIVIARDVAEARYVAEALVDEAFQNVAYFHGGFQEARAALKP